MGSLWSIFITPFKVAYWCTTALKGTLAEVWGKFYKPRQTGAHGSAAWATKKQLKQAGHFNPVGFKVGMFEKKAVYTGKEKNVLVCAPPRQGKTLALASAMLALKEPTDIVVNDPAGDIEGHTAEHFVAQGYRVLTLNIAQPAESPNRFNPMRFLQPQHPFEFEQSIKQLALLLAPDEKTSQPHFQEFNRLMIGAGLIKALLEDVSLTLSDLVEAMADPGSLKKFFEGHSLLAQYLVTKQAYKAYEAVGDKERGSFTSTMARKLEPWGTLPMRHILQPDPKGDWDFETIYRDDKPTIVYLRAGLGNPDAAGVARLVLGIAIYTRHRMWNRGEKFKRPNLYFIDEAATLGDCAPIQQAVDVLAKAKVNVWMNWLSLKSVRDTLTGHENIINACELMVYGGGRDLEVYRSMSELMGDRTIENRGKSESNHGESKSSSEQARRLIKPDELRAMPYSDAAMTLGPLNVKLKKAHNRTKDGIAFL